MSSRSISLTAARAVVTVKSVLVALLACTILWSGVGAIGGKAHAQTSAGLPPPVDYLLGGGDLLRVTVYQNPDLSLETRVSEGGTINFPLLGTLRVGGLSSAQTEALITERLRSGKIVKEPQVTVLVSQVRGNQVNVLGQVNRPGRFPLEVGGMRLSDVLALAGGVAGSGADTITLVRPSADGKPYRGEIDIESVLGTEGGLEDFRVYSGDVLYVGRAPVFYIYGEVQRPGAARLERNMTLMQGLATGGGLTQRGTERGIKIHRREADGSIRIITPKLNDALRNGDVIYVRESLL